MVDCDPNPNLAESFGLSSNELQRFSADPALRRAGDTLALAREPELVEVGERLSLLGGPPSTRRRDSSCAVGNARRTS